MMFVQEENIYKPRLGIGAKTLTSIEYDKQSPTIRRRRCLLGRSPVLASMTGTGLFWDFTAIWNMAKAIVDVLIWGNDVFRYEVCYTLKFTSRFNR